MEGEGIRIWKGIGKEGEVCLKSRGGGGWKNRRKSKVAFSFFFFRIPESFRVLIFLR